MWILIFTVLVITGGIAIFGTLARTRRRAAERAFVLQALAGRGTYGSAAVIAHEIGRNATPRAKADSAQSAHGSRVGRCRLSLLTRRNRKLARELEGAGDDAATNFAPDERAAL